MYGQYEGYVGGGGVKGFVMNSEGISGGGGGGQVRDVPPVPLSSLYLVVFREKFWRKEDFWITALTSMTQSRYFGFHVATC